MGTDSAAGLGDMGSEVARGLVADTLADLAEPVDMRAAATIILEVKVCATPEDIDTMATAADITDTTATGTETGETTTTGIIMDTTVDGGPGTMTTTGTIHTARLPTTSTIHTADITGMGMGIGTTAPEATADAGTMIVLGAAIAAVDLRMTDRSLRAAGSAGDDAGEELHRQM